jgi:hypothetical protein
VRRVDLDVAIRVVAALLIAAAICGFVWYAYPDDLSVRTDILGYPIVQDFNPRVYTVRFLLIAVALPVIAIAVWGVLEALAGRRPHLPETIPAEEAEPPAARRDAPLLSYLKLAAVGGLIATAVAVGVDASSLWPLYLGIPIIVAYVFGVRFAARLIPVARSGTAMNAIAGVNAAVASLSLLAIAVASASTQVDVASPPSSVHYSIAPLWALIPVGLIPAVVVCGLLARRPASDWRRIESWTLLVLGAPVALFLGIAHIVGDLNPPDLFHEGERLGASNLVFGADRFPWRDVLFPHGVLSDVLLPELDTAATSYSRWGLTAGIGMVERPLFWISSLALCVYLFRRNWLFLVASQLLLLIFGWLDLLDNYRMLLLPLSLLAMAALLARSTWPRALLLMAVTGAQAIAVPEATGYSAVIWAAVIAYELVHRRCPGAEPWRTSRSLRIAVSGAALTAAFVLFLALFDSVDGFITYYTTFVGGHDLTGGFPIQWGNFEFHAWVYIPVAVILIGWAYGAARIWSGRWLTTADWVVGAAVIGLIPYYVKFLARADDGHLYQVATVAVIPALYVIYRFLQFLDARGEGSGRSLLRYRPATLVFVLLVIVFAPTAPWSAIGDLPDRFDATADAAPTNDRVGYIVPGTDTDRLARHVERVIDTYAPDGSVFDFTNSPLLFDYLINANTATRFFHVSMAIPADAQRDVIDELEDEKPELVAYSTLVHGLPNWDVVSNPVRHYLISDYLLDHYHPVAKVSDYVFMARNEAAGLPGPQAKRPSRLYFDGLPCEWGFAPNFLDQAPADPADGVDLATKPLGESSGAGGWAADVKTGLPARQVLAVDGDRIVATAPLGVNRQDVAAQLNNPSLTYAGWEFRDALAETGDPSSLTYFGLGRNGVASELGVPANPPPKVLRRPGGGEIPVRQGVVKGSVDYRLPTMDRYELQLPADFQSFDWLQVDSDQQLPESRFLLSDGDAAAGRTIAFNALAGRESEQIRVGSCPQWFGYHGPRLFLDVSPGAGPVTTRLVR